MAIDCDFLLVIPAYEEHRRLPPFLRDLAAHLGDASYTTQIQVLDDGSSATSLRELMRAMDEIKKSRSLQILPPASLKARSGKGCAIRTGWNTGARTKWLAFVDADGAIPAREVSRVFAEISRGSGSPADRTYVAVRDRRVRRTWLRKACGRVFARTVQFVFRCSFQDPQCGFKIIPASTWQNVRTCSLENGFCFDLELLLLLERNKSPIEELPVDWQEKSGGHFRLIGDGIATLFAAGRLRSRHFRAVDGG